MRLASRASFQMAGAADPVTPVRSERTCNCGAGRVRGANYCMRCGGVFPPTPPPPGSPPGFPLPRIFAVNPSLPLPERAGVPLPESANVDTPFPSTPRGATGAATSGDVDRGATPSRRRRISEVAAENAEDPVVTLERAIQYMNRQFSTQMSNVQAEVTRIGNAVMVTQRVQETSTATTEAQGRQTQELISAATTQGGQVLELKGDIENMKTTAQTVTKQLTDAITDLATQTTQEFQASKQRQQLQDEQATRRI